MGKISSKKCTVQTIKSSLRSQYRDRVLHICIREHSTFILKQHFLRIGLWIECVYLSIGIGVEHKWSICGYICCTIYNTIHKQNLRTQKHIWIKMDTFALCVWRWWWCCSGWHCFSRKPKPFEFFLISFWHGNPIPKQIFMYHRKIVFFVKFHNNVCMKKRGRRRKKQTKICK